MTIFAKALTFLQGRKRAYQLAFGSPAGKIVLADLASYCRANETCLVPGDHDKMVILEARREVWLRIQNHLNLTTDELLVLYTQPPLHQEKRP